MLRSMEILSLYHYRDREKREIDFIVECDDETIIAIKVKAGSSLSNDSSKHLPPRIENRPPLLKRYIKYLFTRQSPQYSEA